MNIIQTLEKEQMAKLSAGKDIPDFGPGDTVLVNVKVVEGDRSRVQAYEGVCIARSGGGPQRELHRAEDFLRRRRRARVPALFADDRLRSRSCAAARCAAPSCIICAACAARRPASPSSRPSRWQRRGEEAAVIRLSIAMPKAGSRHFRAGRFYCGSVDCYIGQAPSTGIRRMSARRIVLRTTPPAGTFFRPADGVDSGWSLIVRRSRAMSARLHDPLFKFTRLKVHRP